MNQESTTPSPHHQVNHHFGKMSIENRSPQSPVVVQHSQDPHEYRPDLLRPVISSPPSIVAGFPMQPGSVPPSPIVEVPPSPQPLVEFPEEEVIKQTDQFLQTDSLLNY